MSKLQDDDRRELMKALDRHVTNAVLGAGGDPADLVLIQMSMFANSVSAQAVASDMTPEQADEHYDRILDALRAFMKAQYRKAMELLRDRAKARGN